MQQHKRQDNFHLGLERKREKEGDQNSHAREPERVLHEKEEKENRVEESMLVEKEHQDRHDDGSNGDIVQHCLVFLSLI